MRHFFFDLDGTLADTDADIRIAWKAAIADEGLAAPDFDAKFVAGPPFDEMAKLLFPSDCSAELIERLKAGFASHYDRDGFALTREYPGVREVVRALRAGGDRAYILTNKRHAGTLAMARHFGWEAEFDGIYAGDMHRGDPIGVLKKPALMRLAMDEVGAAAADAVMVGDTRLDFAAARENGVKSVAVGWGYGKPEELALADILVHDAKELKEVLNG